MLFYIYIYIVEGPNPHLVPPLVCGVQHLDLWLGFSFPLVTAGSPPGHLRDADEGCNGRAVTDQWADESTTDGPLDR